MLKCVGIIDFTNVPFYCDYRVGITGIYLFVIGCCVGSFINVLNFRLPLGQSILYPRSRCTKCNCKIKCFDNIPLISWILLGAKCRSCKKKISITYPLIELTTGLIFCANLFAYPSIYNQLPKFLIKNIFYFDNFLEKTNSLLILFEISIQY